MTAPNRSARQSAKTPELQDILLLLALGATWGTAFIGIKISLESFGPLSVAFLRALLASGILVAACVFTQQRWPRDLPTWGLLVGMGLFSTALPFSLISWGSVSVDASRVAILMGIGPFLGIVLPAVLGQGEPITIQKIVGVILGFFGLVLVVGPSALSGSGGGVSGQILVVLASASYVISGLFVVRVTGVSLLMMGTAQTVLATIMLAPLVGSVEGLPDAVSDRSGIAILYLAIIPTALALILRLRLIRRAGVGFMSQVGYLVPLFGVFWGALLLGESLAPRDWVALALILSGIAVLRIKRRKAA